MTEAEEKGARSGEMGEMTGEERGKRVEKGKLERERKAGGKKEKGVVG